MPDYFSDSTSRNEAGLISSDMRFLGANAGDTDPIDTLFSEVRKAIVPDYILIRDVKTSGTNGGTATSGSFQTRDLTEETHDSGSHATLSSNQITLASGTYVFSIIAGTDSGVGRHQAALYNVTDASYIRYGLIQPNNKPGFVTGELTIATSKVFEVRHQVTTTTASTGWGEASSFGTEEVYTIVEFWKTA